MLVKDLIDRLNKVNPYSQLIITREFESFKGDSVEERYLRIAEIKEKEWELILRLTYATNQ